MPRSIQRYGWVPDLPDQRDHVYTAPKDLGTLPPSVDLRPACPPVYFQDHLGSCTANAIAAAIEFDQMKEGRPNIVTPSRLFIYYNERVIAGTAASDGGAHIRDGIKSVARQGTCGEDLWPYDITKFADRPPDACYHAAMHHRVSDYQRIPHDINLMRACLAEGYPFVFGFSAYQSFESPQVAQSGHASLPQPGEQLVAGHTVLAVGYDDAGQWFIARNSWGEGWGMSGYFTMPYLYFVQRNLSQDFWTIRMVH